ncbi:Imm50 family immunity protein [Streptomyces sp. AC602_WCS936]|uniref:Imm50 family immunity protein n=1 Tax=Streptomyces sp. AC602_WCS936 TaxID=2823685 RepID=UPI001C265F67|nr:Imm50 family immunity protein [Streptomyces sp. AC602_WCS936]
MTSDGFLTTPGVLQQIYQRVPSLRDVRMRSINLNWRGPTLTLRLDFASFPENAPQQWVDADVDTVQCQLQFLAVEGVSLTEWEPPATASVELNRHGADRRMRVSVGGSGVSLDFDSSDSVLVGHVSAFKVQADGSDGGTHLFLSKLDARRHTALPDTCEKTFYERI